MPKYEGKPTKSEKNIKAKQRIQKDKKKTKNECVNKNIVK
jgi:hypothetical protein